MCKSGNTIIKPIYYYLTATVLYLQYLVNAAFGCISVPKLCDFFNHALQKMAIDEARRTERAERELATRRQEYENRRLQANDEKEAIFAQRRLANRRVYAQAVPVEAPGQPVEACRRNLALRYQVLTDAMPADSPPTSKSSAEVKV